MLNCPTIVALAIHMNDNLLLRMTIQSFTKIFWNYL